MTLRLTSLPLSQSVSARVVEDSLDIRHVHFLLFCFQGRGFDVCLVSLPLLLLSVVSADTADSQFRWWPIRIDRVGQKYISPDVFFASLDFFVKPLAALKAAENAPLSRALRAHGHRLCAALPTSLV